ncbi:MAG: hypothetical protein ACFFDQ_05245 [Candidatus Thorarchaeota archaeon]
MSAEGKIYRVFTCPRCHYTGYKQVLTQDDESTCNLCSMTIQHSPEMKYTHSVDEALDAMQRIVTKSRLKSKPKSRYGLGVKRRVLNIVSDLSDLNQGKGVTLWRVLQECEEASIDIERAKRFLNQLEEEGLIIDVDGRLTAVECDDW